MPITAPGYGPTTRTTCSAGCAGSRARSAASSAWSTRTPYCIDVLTQVSAATKALQAVALELLDGHLSTASPTRSARAARPPHDKIAEASAAVARLVRS